MDLGARRAACPTCEEHIKLVNSILGTGPYLNESQARGRKHADLHHGAASRPTPGLEITWDQIMASKQDLQPKDFDYDRKMPPEPLPVPGIYKFI